MKLRKLSSKIKTPRSAQSILRKLRRKNYGSKKPLKIVFTNGCFDLLHKGHVIYLEKARQQGDFLVVALNSDASVQRLKGPMRPLNPLADRAEVIAALECIDLVTWFEEDTPQDLILKLHPDVLVKGGDWKVDQIVGGKEVLAWGGKVKSLPYIEGHSTTKLIEKSQTAGLPKAI